MKKGCSGWRILETSKYKGCIDDRVRFDINMRDLHDLDFREKSKGRVY